MDDFSRYFEDKRFVRWVFHPTPAIETYWEQYLQDHPDEKHTIELARTILSQLRSKKAGEEEPELYELYAGIMRHIDHKRKSGKIWLAVARYAAVALILLSVGIVWKNTGRKSVLPELSETFVRQAVPEGNETQLILPDGRNIAIVEKKSTIRMQKGGDIIINQKDTVHREAAPASDGVNQLIVPFGKNASVRLPDGTMAWLNAGSRLIYPSRFEGKRREVLLVGEGFFEVAHNPEMPFIVSTTDLKIKALGTAFNVSAYPRDPVIEVALAEGKVGLTQTGVVLAGRQQILVPGQLAAFTRETRTTSIKDVNVENYISWHKGYLNMESTELYRIVVKLERYYNIEIDFEEPLSGKKLISGKIVLKEKDGVLRVLASTASLELIHINEHKYVLK